MDLRDSLVAQPEAFHDSLMEERSGTVFVNALSDDNHEDVVGAHDRQQAAVGDCCF
jgi:hypothetical protein